MEFEFYFLKYFMENLSLVSTDELEKELEARRRGKVDRCPACRGKWTIYMGCSDSWVKKPHCFGCRRPVESCTC